MRKTITVRYLKSDKTLSRPHKILKVINKEGKLEYWTLNQQNQLDPSTFVTNWENKKSFKTDSKVTINSIWEYIRIKFKPGCGPGRAKSTIFSRPQKIYKITTGELIEYAPAGVKGTLRRLDVNDMIFEWERAGKTPTERPLRKYDDATLRKRGYTIEEIRKIRERNFSAKDIKLVAKKLKLKNAEARELLIKHNGKKHKLYETERKNTSVS